MLVKTKTNPATVADNVCQTGNFTPTVGATDRITLLFDPGPPFPLISQQ